MLGTDVAATLDWCVDVGRHAPVVGEGETRRLWELLAAVAMRSVSAARMLEPHLDALSILRQSGTDLFRQQDPWGLERIAARRGLLMGRVRGGVRRRAARGEQHGRRVGPAGHQALVLARRRCLARSGDGVRRRVASAAVRGGHARVGRASASERVVRARACRTWSAVLSTSTTHRPCRSGTQGGTCRARGSRGAGCRSPRAGGGRRAGIADALVEPARSERADQLALVHLGRVDAALWAARATLAEAADLVDGGAAAAAR